jgi:zinc transporter 7
VLFFVNFQDSKDFLRVLLSFASGGLLGDVFLHLLPHAAPAHSHSDHEGHSHNPLEEMGPGLWIILGFFSFYVIEKIFLRSADNEDGHSHSHSHSHEKEKKEADPKSKETKSKESKEVKSKESKPEEKNNNNAPTKEESRSQFEFTILEKNRSAAFLNLIADTLHNFTDGMAIGASFLAGRSIVQFSF